MFSNCDLEIVLNIKILQIYLKKICKELKGIPIVCFIYFYYYYYLLLLIKIVTSFYYLTMM